MVLEISISTTIFITVGCVVTILVITMYILIEKLKSIKRKRSVNYQSTDNIISISGISQQMNTQNTGNVANFAQPAGSVTPPKPARSFSGQFCAKKVSPASRKLAKINSQIILFNGQPHILTEQLHRRLSRAEIFDCKPSN